MRVAFALIAALAATPALASEPTPEAPVATAAAGDPPSTAEQVEAFIRNAPPATVTESQAVDGVVSGDDRKVHGEVSVGVGSHGYRNFYARSDMPLGETGRLSIAVQDTRFNGRFGPWSGRGVGASLAFGQPLGLDHRRCDPDAAIQPRPMDVVGPVGRCARPPGAW